jgi:hypothetical protein
MFLVVLGFEFRASCLLNRHSTTWSTSQVPRNGSVVTKLWAPLPCRHTTWGNGTGIKYNKLHTLVFIGSIKALPWGGIVFLSSSLRVWAPKHSCQQPNQSKFNLALNSGSAPAGLSWKCQLLAGSLQLQSKVWRAKENSYSQS